MNKIAVITVCLLVAGCSDSTTAERALDAAGYTNVKTTGYKFFSCGKDDAFSTGFIAKGPTGKNVTGAVCSGWFKSSTIRLD
jgi:hypothetical protein